MSKATAVADALRAFKKKFSPEDTYYHGTAGDIKEFRDSSLGTFLSPEPEFASKFAKNRAGFKAKEEGTSMADAAERIDAATGANVMPLHANKGKNFDYETADREMFKGRVPPQYQGMGEAFFIDDIMQGEWNAIENPWIQNVLKENNYDSYFVNEGGLKNLAVYDPANIRSVNAKFDPTQVKSRNILAGVGGASILGAAANPQTIQAQEPQTLTDTATDATADALRALGMNPHRAADNADVLNTLAGFIPTVGAIQLGSDVGHYARKGVDYLKNNFIGGNPLFDE